ncbi:hypothetical protein A3740_06225 [Oleiphilus sp. HI0068]|nr:hypothetical protein A3741_09460 [Oleiphilus sp. HI0069]KZY81336.1 hypothetical protein A3740_06225 [Oleiphilus sp. HI0068]
MSESEIQTLMQQANEYIQSERLSRARRCYNKILSIDPQNCDAHYSLGTIARQQNDNQAAKQHLLHVYQAEPLNRTFVLELAGLYADMGMIVESAKVFEAYLSVQDDIELSGKYAEVLVKAKEFERAVECLKACVGKKPENLSYRMQLGNLLYQLLRFEEAQSVYLSAIEYGLKSEGLYLNAAKLHVDHGQLAVAKDVLNKGSEDFPENLSFAYRLVQLDAESLRPELYQRLVDVDEATLEGDNRFYYQWLLANFAKNRGQQLVEMEHLVAAHRIYSSITQFPRSTEFYLQALPQLTPPDSAHFTSRLANLEPVFIIGVPRCGSTLLENIICHGPQNVGKGEETGSVIEALAVAYQSGGQNFWEAFVSQLESSYMRHGLLPEDSSSDVKRFTDKSLENIFLIDFIMKVMPRAKVVYCDRAPLASIVSIMRNNMSVLPWAHDLNNIFKYVDNCLVAMDRTKNAYPQRVTTVKYEELVCDPEAESKALMAFCDLPWGEQCLDFHKEDKLLSRTASHVQIRREINQDAVSAYKQYESFFEPFSEIYHWAS